MAKRLTRARQKIKQARIPYRVPPDHELPDRWAAVLATAYLLFNEGYAATSGADLVRTRLVDEAIRLTRLLVAAATRRPGHARPAGADAAAGLASRDPPRRDRRAGAAAPTRTARGGTARPSRRPSPWSAKACAARPARPDRYVVQAAIAACHALAPSWEETDWARDRVLVRRAPHRRRAVRSCGSTGRPPWPSGTARPRVSAWSTPSPAWSPTRCGTPRERCCCDDSGRDDEAAAADAVAASLPLNDPQRGLLGRAPGEAHGG